LPSDPQAFKLSPPPWQIPFSSQHPLGHVAGLHAGAPSIVTSADESPPPESDTPRS
jgi:hypothetical protein